MKKFFFVDIDGVMTDGTKTYSNDGLPVSKKFYDKDFTALKELQAAGYRVIWVSGDDFVNKNVAKNRNYEFVSARGKNKGDCIREILAQETGEDIRSICVGDDLFDLDMLPIVDRFYLPANSYWRLLKLAKGDSTFHVLNTIGGHGVIEEICSIENADREIETMMQKVLELDNKEKF